MIHRAVAMAEAGDARLERQAQVRAAKMTASAALILSSSVFVALSTEQPKRTRGRIARALGASSVQSIEIRKHGPAPDFTVGWDGLQ